MLSLLFFFGLCAAWFVVLTNGRAKGRLWKVPLFAVITHWVLGIAWRLVVGLVPIVLAVVIVGVACLVFLAIGRAIFKEA